MSNILSEKNINELIKEKIYKIFLNGEYNRIITGKVINFTSGNGNVIFNEDKNELYIFKFSDIETMFPIKNIKHDVTLTNLETGECTYFENCSDIKIT